MNFSDPLSPVRLRPVDLFGQAPAATGIDEEFLVPFPAPFSPESLAPFSPGTTSPLAHRSFTQHRSPSTPRTPASSRLLVPLPLSPKRTPAKALDFSDCGPGEAANYNSTAPMTPPSSRSAWEQNFQNTMQAAHSAFASTFHTPNESMEDVQQFSPLSPVTPPKSSKRAINFSNCESSAKRSPAPSTPPPSFKSSDPFFSQSKSVSTSHSPKNFETHLSLVPEKGSFDKFANCARGASSRQAPDAPCKRPEDFWADKKRKKPGRVLSDVEIARKNKFDRASDAHDTLRLNCRYLASGNFKDTLDPGKVIRENVLVELSSYVDTQNLSALDQGSGIVLKVPKRDAMAKSINSHECFKQLSYMAQNYEQLKNLEKNGVFPANFRIAKTIFIPELAVIAQEKLDRPLTSDDLKNPAILDAIREVIRFAYTTKSTLLDFKPDNLLVRVIRDESGKEKEVFLTLIDWNEQDDDSFGDCIIRLEPMLMSFANLGANPKERTKLYQYLDPRNSTSEVVLHT